MSKFNKKQIKNILNNFQNRLMITDVEAVNKLIGQFMTYSGPKKNQLSYKFSGFKTGDIVRIVPPKYPRMYQLPIEKFKKKCYGLTGTIRRRSYFSGGLVYLEMHEPQKVPKYFLKDRKWLCWPLNEIKKDLIGYMKNVKRNKKAK